MAVVKTASPTARAGRADADAGPGRAVREVEPDLAHAATRARRVCATLPAGQREQAASLHLAAEEGAVAAARAEVGLAHDVALAQIPEREVGLGSPTAMRGRGSPKARAGPGRHALDDQLERDDAGLDEPVRRAPGRRSRGRSRRSAPPGTAPPSRPGGAARGRSRCSRSCRRAGPRSSACRCALGRQRRAHLEARGVERAAPPRRSAAGGAARPRRRRRRPSCARSRTSSTDSRDVQVAEVERPALVARDAQVAGDHRRLGDRRVADRGRAARRRALVHVGRARERRVLAVQREHAPGRRGVLQRAPQQRRRESTGRPSSE